MMNGPDEEMILRVLCVDDGILSEAPPIMCWQLYFINIDVL